MKRQKRPPRMKKSPHKPIPAHAGNGHPPDPRERLTKLIEKAVTGELTKSEQGEIALFGVGHLSELLERQTLALEGIAEATLEKLADIAVHLERNAAATAQGLEEIAGSLNERLALDDHARVVSPTAPAPTVFEGGASARTP